MSTPTRTRDKSVPLQSTPQARGTASHDSYDEQHTQGDYGPYLAEDLKAKTVIALDAFCTHVFFPPSAEYREVVKKIANYPALQTLLKNYCKPVDLEEDRYHLFTDLANK